VAFHIPILNVGKSQITAHKMYVEIKKYLLEESLFFRIKGLHPGSIEETTRDSLTQSHQQNPRGKHAIFACPATTQATLDNTSLAYYNFHHPRRGKIHT
jgi:hypothetical protein